MSEARREPRPARPTEGVLTDRVHIVCSPYKTGTTSVGKALLALGVGRREMPYDRTLASSLRPQIRPLNTLAMRAENFRTFRHMHEARVLRDLAPLVEALRPYDVFHDAPFGHTQIHVFIRKTLAPEARFIWVNRAEQDWLESVRHWEETHPEVYPSHVEWSENAEARAAKKRNLWKQHKRQFLRIRRVAPEHCLEMAWSDLGDWSALADFYGVAPPATEFPKANVSRF